MNAGAYTLVAEVMACKIGFVHPKCQEHRVPSSDFTAHLFPSLWNSKVNQIWAERNSSSLAKQGDLTVRLPEEIKPGRKSLKWN